MELYRGLVLTSHCTYYIPLYILDLIEPQYTSKETAEGLNCLSNPSWCVWTICKYVEKYCTVSIEPTNAFVDNLQGNRSGAALYSSGKEKNEE